MRIWLLCSELHLSSGDQAEAEQCLAEARALSPLNYLLMHARGLTLERRGELESAASCYESALGVNPSHVPSLKHLGRVNHGLGHHRTAEQALKVAARIEPNDENVWALLGSVKEAIGKDSPAVIEELARPDAIKWVNILSL